VNFHIGKNVRRCALKYGIGEGDVGCWGFRISYVLFGALSMVCHGRFLRGRILHARSLLHMYNSVLSKEEFSSIIDFIANY